jgi:hypothetical protein
VFKDILKITNFSRQESELLRKKIAIETDLLERNLKAKEDPQKSLNDYASKLAKFFISDMQKQGKKNKSTAIANLYEDTKVEEKLIKGLQAKLISKIRAPKRTIDMDNTKVLVQAHKLKEIPPESIVRIKMTLVEEGMEWHTIERDNGEIDQKLLPE